MTVIHQTFSNLIQHEDIFPLEEEVISNNEFKEKGYDPTNEPQSDESNESILNISLNNSNNELLQDSFESSTHSCENSEPECIYPNSKVKIKELAISILTLKFKHKLSEAALDDKVKFIKFHHPISVLKHQNH